MYYSSLLTCSTVFPTEYYRFMPLLGTNRRLIQLDTGETHVHIPCYLSLGQLFSDTIKSVILQWWIQDGAFGVNAPPTHLVKEPAMLLIKIATKLCQAKISLSTYETMHILLALITNSLTTKANQSQTSCQIVTQHLCAY